MLKRYSNKRIGQDNLQVISQANEIIEEYAKDGYLLTLRQIYYQFVARTLLPNTQKAYKRLGSILSDGRMCGLIPWDMIEDRTRNLTKQPAWRSPTHIVKACASSYRIDKWAHSQTNRVEVWVEKEALAGIFDRVCTELQIDYFSCRGYVSQSEMWSAAERLIAFEDEGIDTHILHFGDHDPSGIDMSRDIADRLAGFGSVVDVRRIGLNMGQIIKHKPPPNPTKLTDARAKGYVKQYGNQSWELDALDPSTLSTLVREYVDTYRDDAAWAVALDVEHEGQAELDAVSLDWGAALDAVIG